MRVFRLLLLISAVPLTDVGAQLARDTATVQPQKTFFVKRDLALAGVALAGSAALSVFDERIARWSQTANVQGSASRTETVESLTRINETPLTLLSVAAYGLGRLSRSNAVADVGLHTAEALVLTIAVSELIRVPVGRIRPRTAEGAFEFDVGGGLTRFEARSFPSLHTSAAYAAAAALSGELRMRKPTVARFAVPALYTLAAVPGLTRIYLDQHWASDVAAGAVVGALLGSRVVSYAHSHNVSRLDRALLAITILPTRDGGATAMVRVN